jgi:hypothetical protein
MQDSEIMKAYVKHGTAPAPCREEKVPFAIDSKAPKSPSRTGYGSKLPTQYRIHYKGRWRRVYAICFSNVATFYIPDGKDKLIVSFY